MKVLFFIVILPLFMCTKSIYKGINEDIDIDTTTYKIMKIDTVFDKYGDKRLKVRVKEIK